MSGEIGRVTGLARFPVKSMRGESLERAEIGFQGFPGDRRYAFVQADSRSPFPWFTGREYAALVRYVPVFEEGAAQSRLLVTTPGGAAYPIASDDLRRELEAAAGGRSLFLLADHRGSYDIAQVSLVTVATVRAIALAAGVDPDPARFRMNIVVDTGDDVPFTEADWVGRVLRLGDTARVAVTEPDRRCAMITIDPATAATDAGVLRAAADLNGTNAGVYASVVAVGPIRLGDQVVIGS